MREKSPNGLCVVVLGLRFFGLTAAVRAKPITDSADAYHKYCASMA